MAPTTAPKVAQKITPTILILVVVVIKPPKVKITSEGIGGKTFSIVIRRKIPRYPKSFIKLIIIYNLKLKENG